MQNTMKLFLVIRYGNEDEGADGKDTLYLVSSKDKKEASSLVDNELKSCTSTAVHSFCNVIYELGFASDNFDKTDIICGPLIDKAMIEANGLYWIREDEDEQWVLGKEYFAD